MLLLMKYIKTFLHGRAPQVKDVLIDSAGGICGSGITLLIIKYFVAAHRVRHKENEEDTENKN